MKIPITVSIFVQQSDEFTLCDQAFIFTVSWILRIRLRFIHNRMERRVSERTMGDKHHDDLSADNCKYTVLFSLFTVHSCFVEGF